MVELGIFHILCVYTGLIASPFFKKSVFCTAGLDGFDHFYARYRSTQQFSGITHGNPGNVHPFLRDNAGHEHIDQNRGNTNQRKRKAVTDHNHQIEYHHTGFNHQRCQGVHKRFRNFCIGANSLLNITSHSLRKEFHWHSEQFPHECRTAYSIDFCADTGLIYCFNKGNNDLYDRKSRQCPDKGKKPLGILPRQQTVDKNPGKRGVNDTDQRADNGGDYRKCHRSSCAMQFLSSKGDHAFLLSVRPEGLRRCKHQTNAGKGTVKGFH